MLRRLFVENVALIDKLDVEFSDGLNIMTGETGAGKSIIIDAVNLVLGERANKELIKFGTTKAKVEAVFDVNSGTALLSFLNENGIDMVDDNESENEDKEIFISRELSANGKNICRVNGTMVTLSTLKAITDMLVDIHGQHEHQSLLNDNTHIKFLDSFCHNEIDEIKGSIAKVYSEYKKVNSQLLNGFASEGELARRIDILSYQINEISNARLSKNEEEQLEEERKLLINSERIKSTLERSSVLSDIVSDIKGIMNEFEGISNFTDEYLKIFSTLTDSYYAIEDVAMTIRDANSSFEYNPERLDEIEQRLDEISLLKRKYGADVGEILKFLENAQNELNELMSSGERKNKLELERKKLANEYYLLADKLSEIRKSKALELENRIVKELVQLGLTKSRFKVEFEESEKKHISLDGYDKILFLISTNSGEPLKPLSKVASGGEMSRIMLAIKNIFADADDIGTLIFDEIDTGISGNIAGIVGEKMAEISRGHQVICITHLPQVASFADSHYLVEKHDEGEGAKTTLRRLEENERYKEIARIMGVAGDKNIAEQHAKAMITQSNSFKSEIRQKYKA